MFLYRSVAERARGGAWGGYDWLRFPRLPQAPPRARSATDLYKNTVVLLFLVRYLRLGTRLNKSLNLIVSAS